MFGKHQSKQAYEGPKIKGGSFDMAGAAGVIGMLGSAIGKGDGDATTFTKKEKKGVLMSSTLRCWYRALGTIMPGIEPQ
jgi:hypothetical protein